MTKADIKLAIRVYQADAEAIIQAVLDVTGGFQNCFVDIWSA